MELLKLFEWVGKVAYMTEIGRNTYNYFKGKTSRQATEPTDNIKMCLRERKGRELDSAISELSQK